MRYFFSTLWVVLLTATVALATEVYLETDAPNGRIELNQQVTVYVYVTDVDSLGGVSITLEYDQSLLNVNPESWTFGQFMLDVGECQAPLGAYPPDEQGWSNYTFAFVRNGDLPCAYGSGELCSVTFTAVGEGVCPINFRITGNYRSDLLRCVAIPGPNDSIPVENWAATEVGIGVSDVGSSSWGKIKADFQDEEE
ncbi:MAG: hypothetical protein D6675_08480 [Gemmatimonadetes bacterium]|nr:MAG: hypothetical protein D6675_08480 [Gemmatimonadota bacterium]